MENLLVSEQYPEPVAEGTSVVVCYDYKKNQSTRIPEVIRLSIEKLEDRVFEID